LTLRVGLARVGSGEPSEQERIATGEPPLPLVQLRVSIDVRVASHNQIFWVLEMFYFLF